MSLEDILQEIQKSTNLAKEELEAKIEEKQKELSGLVSIEGAAYLVATELGLDLLGKKRRKFEIKNISSGLKNLTLYGRIFKVSPIVEFQRQDGSSGKVSNIFLGDDTGFVRAPLWNEQVDLIEEGTIKVGDAIQIINAMSRDSIYGGTEIVLGKYGKINPIEAPELPSAEDLDKKYFGKGFERRDIKNLGPGSYEISGTIVQIFRGRFLFETCPICKTTLKKKDDKFVCVQDGEVEPKHSMLLAGILDDGTSNIRTVFFRENAESLLGASIDDLLAIDEEKRHDFINERVVGKELVLQGRVKKNKVFNREEFIVSKVKPLNVSEESKRLAEELELKQGE